MPAHTTIIEAALGLLAALSYAGGLGTVRLLLALLVVGSHVGGLGATNAGGVGIAGFFAISGFLMAQTILNNYRGSGIDRFYFNRFIRLAPPLAALMALTASIVWMRDAAGFQLRLDSTARFMPVELPPSPIHWFNWGRRGYPVFLEPSFYTLPQAWSLVTEGCFYLVAPLFAWFVARRLAVMLVLAVSVSGFLTSQSAFTSTGWIRSPVASFWIFGLGMLTFTLTSVRHLRPAPEHLLRLLGTLILECLLLVTFGLTPLTPHAALVVAPLLVLSWLWLSQSFRPAPPAWDRAIGNWSYGVFLGHFASTLTMFWIAEVVHDATGVFGIFGIPDQSDLRLATSVYVFAMVFGIGIYHAFERPFEVLRARVRVRPGERQGRV